MNVLLTLGVVFACSVALSSAQCMTGKFTYNFKTRTPGCEYQGGFYKTGSEWISNCTECSCRQSGLTCCSLVHTPVYDEKTCEAVYNMESCSYTVTKKNNPSEFCEITAMVG